MKRVSRILMGLVMIGGVWWVFQGAAVFKFYRFDAALWAKTKTADRYYMAKYLVDHRSLIGLTREEMVSRIGTTDAPDRSYLRYPVGPDFLDIVISSGKVESAMIRPN